MGINTRQIQVLLWMFNMIQEIYLVDGCSIAFHLKVCSTKYEPHYCAYLLKKDCREKILQLSSLFVETPVHINLLGHMLLLFYLLHYVLCSER